MTDYLKKILTARVYDVAIESPLEPAPNLSKRTKNHILLKREDMQSVFSFKLRGAYNKMANLSASQLRLLIEDCSEKEAAAMIPVLKSVLAALRDKNAITIE